MSDLAGIRAYLNESKENREAFVHHILVVGLTSQLRILVDQRGWTQAELAERAGLAASTISEVMNPATVSNTCVKTLLKIAHALDVALVSRFGTFTELAQWALEIERFAPSEYTKEFRGEGDKNA